MDSKQMQRPDGEGEGVDPDVERLKAALLEEVEELRRKLRDEEDRHIAAQDEISEMRTRIHHETARSDQNIRNHVFGQEHRADLVRDLAVSEGQAREAEAQLALALAREDAFAKALFNVARRDIEAGSGSCWCPPDESIDGTPIWAGDAPVWFSDDHTSACQQATAAALARRNYMRSMQEDAELQDPAMWEWEKPIAVGPSPERIAARIERAGIMGREHIGERKEGRPNHEVCKKCRQIYPCEVRQAVNAMQLASRLLGRAQEQRRDAQDERTRLLESLSRVWRAASFHSGSAGSLGILVEFISSEIEKIGAAE